MVATEDQAATPGQSRPEAGRAIVTTLNVLSLLPLAVVSSLGWFLLLIGIADQGGTAGAYVSGGLSLLVPWAIWLGSVVLSQWLWPRMRALASIAAALPLAAELALFLHFH